MKRAKYLNVILTVIAVLLSALVWVSIANRPLLSSSAQAAPPRVSGNPGVPGIPDAGSQRLAIQRAIKEVEADVKLLHKLLASGKLRVEVTNLSELRREDGSGSERTE